MYQTLQFKIRGLAPTIMHNGQLADPLNQWSKELKKITSKRKKTDDDYAEMARLEWYGSLYLNEDRQPCIPGENIEAMIVTAAKKQSMGPKAKAGILCDDLPLLAYDGPKNPDELWPLPQFRKTCKARVGTASVMRTRPIFQAWSLSFEIAYLPDVLNEADVRDFMTTASQLVGLSDWRPKFGRFEVMN